MDAKQLGSARARLERFVREISAPMGRKERRHWAGCYLRGLLLDGERKSVEPLAARVLEGARPPQAAGAGAPTVHQPESLDGRGAPGGVGPAL